MMAMNGLLAQTSSLVLCLHDHSFGHLTAAEHTSAGHDCHGAEESPHQHHEDKPAHGIFADTEAHCFDILITAHDEAMQRASDLLSVKKLDIAVYQYRLFVPIIKANAAPQISLATRAPPISCSTLEQCVRKTVLRI